jgi:hypothetical protein
VRQIARAGGAIAALVVSLAVAGCGGTNSEGVARLDGGTTTSAQQASRDFEDAALDYAECVREHGVDMPDPQNGGFVITPDTDPTQQNEDTFRSADAKCRKHLENVKPPQISEQDKEAFQKAALEHARCMRERGIDMPDPTMTEDGGAAVSLDGIDPKDPKFKRAQQACAGKLRAVMGGGSE